MTEKTTHAAPLLADHAQYLITTAARAPSVHNTQPWRFGVGRSGVELYCDPRRKLRADPLGREMIISCGAALFGLRLAVRGLGYLPVIELMPDPNQPRLLARVGMGAAVPVTRGERRMLEAVPHRHTHRGPFEPGPLPAGLLAGLQHDALAEGAELALVEGELAYQRLASVVAVAASRMDLDPRVTGRDPAVDPRGRQPGSRRRPGRGLHRPSPAQAQAAAAAARLRPGPRPGPAARRRGIPVRHRGAGDAR